MPVKVDIAVLPNMGQRTSIATSDAAIFSVDHQQIGPAGIFPPEYPKGIIGCYLELVIHDQEIVAAQRLRQRVRLPAQLPDVIGVGEPGKVR